MYKCLKLTKSDAAIFEERKQRFNQYKNTLRKTITQAKKYISLISLPDM